MRAIYELAIEQVRLVNAQWPPAVHLAQPRAQWRPFVIGVACVGALLTGRCACARAQPMLDMPEVLWKSYIDFEIELAGARTEQGNADAAAAEYERARALSSPPREDPARQGASPAECAAPQRRRVARSTHRSRPLAVRYARTGVDKLRNVRSVGEERRRCELRARGLHEANDAAQRVAEGGAQDAARTRGWRTSARPATLGHKNVEAMLPRKVKKRRQITATDGVECAARLSSSSEARAGEQRASLCVLRFPQTVEGPRSTLTTSSPDEKSRVRQSSSCCRWRASGSMRQLRRAAVNLQSAIISHAHTGADGGNDEMTTMTTTTTMMTTTTMTMTRRTEKGREGSLPRKNVTAQRRTATPQLSARPDARWWIARVAVVRRGAPRQAPSVTLGDDGDELPASRCQRLRRVRRLKRPRVESHQPRQNTTRASAR